MFDAAADGKKLSCHDTSKTENQDSSDAAKNKYLSKILINGTEFPSNPVTVGSLALHRNFDDWQSNSFKDGDGKDIGIDGNKVWFNLGVGNLKDHKDTLGFKLDGTDVITIKAGFPIKDDGTVLDKDFSYAFCAYKKDGDPQITRFFPLADATGFTATTVVDILNLPSETINLPAGEAHSLPAQVELLLAGGSIERIPATYAWTIQADAALNVQNAITCDVSAYTFRAGKSLPGYVTFNIVAMANTAAVEEVSYFKLLDLGGNKYIAFELMILFNETATIADATAFNSTFDNVNSKVQNITVNGTTLKKISEEIVKQKDFIRTENFKVEFKQVEVDSIQKRALMILLPANIYDYKGVGFKGDGTDVVVIPAGGSSATGFSLPEDIAMTSEFTSQALAVTENVYDGGTMGKFAARDELTFTPEGAVTGGILGFAFTLDCPSIGKKLGRHEIKAYADSVLVNGISFSDLLKEEGSEKNNLAIHVSFNDFNSSTSWVGDLDLNKYFAHIAVPYNVKYNGKNLLKFDGNDVITLKKDFPSILSKGLVSDYAFKVKVAPDKEQRGFEQINNLKTIIQVLPVEGIASDATLKYGQTHNYASSTQGLTVLGEKIEMSVTYNWTSKNEIDVFELIATAAMPEGYVKIGDSLNLDTYYSVQIIDFIVSFNDLTLPDSVKVNTEMTLPSKITAVFASGATLELDILWDWTSAQQAGDKLLTGTISLGDNVLNDGVSGQITKTVKVTADKKGCTTVVPSSGNNGITALMILLSAFVIVALTVGMKKTAKSK